MTYPMYVIWQQHYWLHQALVKPLLLLNLYQHRRNFNIAKGPFFWDFTESHGILFTLNKTLHGLYKKKLEIGTLCCFSKWAVVVNVGLFDYGKKNQNNDYFESN